MLREQLTGYGIDPHGTLLDDVVLLASELFENAVLHAGTVFEVDLRVDDEEIFVGVRDHGVGPLEQYLGEPRRSYGRAATHGRGLLLLQRMAAAWGTRHEPDGSHQIWFTVSRRGSRLDHPAEAAHRSPAPPATPAHPTATPLVGADWSDLRRLDWLLQVPAHTTGGLAVDVLVAELVRRLRELVGAAGVAVEADAGDGDGVRELARDGVDPSTVDPDRVVGVPLPLSPPLRGTLSLARPEPEPGGPVGGPLAQVAAQRIALAVESDWLRGAERRRQNWLGYLADTSELLGQSLDVGLTVTVIPHVAVPRLGQWCAVYLPDSGQPRLAAVSHADERSVAELREALELGSRRADPLRRRVLELMHGETTVPTSVNTPAEGIAVPMTSAGRPVGVLLVGRRADRAHSPEDVTIIADIARRAALAIDNAQRAEQHSSTSRALQQALLPRALPTSAGVDFAAAYVPGGALTEVGGDFYDVVPMAGGGWLAAIGDVCGKGARAASRTSLVRDVLRVLFRDRGSLVSTIFSLNEVMLEAADPAQFCTLAAATISRTATELSVDLVLAGHPQPVLLRAGGGVEYVGRFGTAIGLVDRIELTRTAHKIGPGDTLLFYTDGVTERRRGNDQFGPERLLEVAGTCSGMSAERTVSTVRAAVESFSPDERRDDIALLAIRADATP
jgi:serine phosphatase RsbU (regulator of sigma subunit)/anti-sigma regulatory factor (Ser/Thr protein kinase)